MAALTDTTIASTYKQLLKLTSEGVSADASAKYVEDGLGTDTALSLSTTRVGIGTASPSAELNVEGTGMPSIHISRDKSAGAFDANGWGLGVLAFGGQDSDSGEDNDSAYIRASVPTTAQGGGAWSGSSHPTQLGFYTTPTSATSASERMTISASGDVGIGVTSPQAMLHVNDGTSTSEDSGILLLSNYDTSFSDTQALGQVHFGGTRNNTHWGVGAIISAEAAEAWDADNEYGTDLFFRTAAIGASSTTVKMMITSEGNVGIGTTSPASPLHIANAANDSQLIIDNTASSDGTPHSATIEFRIRNSNANDPVGKITYIEDSNDGYGNLTFGVSPGTNSSTVSESMRIDEYGRVGINDTDPSEAMLSIVTNASVNGIKIDNNHDDDAMYIDNTGSDESALMISSDNNADQDSPLVVIQATNSNFDQEVLRVYNWGTNVSLQVVKQNAGDHDAIALFQGSDSNQPLWVSNLLCGSDEDRVGLTWVNQGVGLFRNWCDDTGDLRISNADPSADDSGTVVGSQSFSGTHIYKTDETDLEVGESVKLVNRKIVRTSSANEKTCVGIYAGQSWKVEDSFGDACNETDGYGHAVLALGDTIHKQTDCSVTGVIVDGAVSAGDLLCTSATAGKLTKQSDDIMRSSTVGKAMEDGDENSPVYSYIYCG